MIRAAVAGAGRSTPAPQWHAGRAAAHPKQRQQRYLLSKPQGAAAGAFTPNDRQRLHMREAAWRGTARRTEVDHWLLPPGIDPGTPVRLRDVLTTQVVATATGAGLTAGVRLRLPAGTVRFLAIEPF